jgi:hypothetical protein
MKNFYLFKWRLLFILLFFGVFNAAVFADDDSDPKMEFIDGDNTITPESPSVKMRFLCADIDGYDSYWDNVDHVVMNVYKNNDHFCTFTDLDFLRTKGDAEDQWEGIRNEDGAWKSLIQNGKVAVVFYNPYRSGDAYWVNIEVLPLIEFHENDVFTIKINGHYTKNQDNKVFSNGYSKHVEVSLTTAAVNPKYFSGGSYKRVNGAVIYTPDNLQSLGGNLEYLLQFKEDDMIKRYNFHPAKHQNIRYLIGNKLPYHVSLVQSVTNKGVTMKDNKKYEVVFKKDFGFKDISAYVYPTLFLATGEPWKKEMKLSWVKGNANANQDGKWVVMRTGSDANSNYAPLEVEIKDNGIGRLEAVDKQVEYAVPYKYKVCFVPNEWNEVAYASDLSALADATLNNFYKIDLQAKPTANSVELNWKCAGFEKKNASYEFHVYRSINSVDYYEKIATIPVDSKTKTDYKFEDNSDKLGSSCDVFRYKVCVHVFEIDNYSNEVQVHLDGTTDVTHIEASCGEFANMVRLKWQVEQVGNAHSTFRIYRRVLGQQKETEWVSVGSVSGTDREYMYEDHSTIPGYYYQYKLTLVSPCVSAANGKETLPEKDFYADGFCMQKGSVSGRITYGTNVATEGVKVMALQTSDMDHSLDPAFYALRVNGKSGGVTIPFSSSKTKSVFQSDAGFAVQLWVSLDEGLTKAPLMVWNKQVGLYAELKDGAYQLTMEKWDGDKPVAMSAQGKVVLEAEKYKHITCMYDAHSQMWQVWEACSDSIVQKANFAMGEKFQMAGDSELTLGVANMDAAAEFKGFIDEVRVWKRTLTETEIVRNHCRILDGKEDDLSVYLMFDENIYNQRKAYDYSYGKDGAPNGMHASLGLNNEICSHVPTDEQLSNYALTDKNGNYTLNALSVGKGEMTYAITPILGIHRFDPVNTMLRVTSNSLVHNGIDFKDQSSFKVSGYVYYENTNYPVKGCTVKVDGVPCVYNDEDVKTDENGRFVISVPIGDHYITVEKEGHTFRNGGRYPADENGHKLHTFNQEMSGLTFVDETKAIVVGRVAGGAAQYNQPLGSGLGKANIGAATITLKASDYILNAVTKQDGLATDVVIGEQPLPYENATDGTIGGKAYVGGGSEAAARTVTIKTDPKTGEFAVLLPPVVYTVEGVNIDHNIDNITFKNLPEIDASDMAKSDTARWVVTSQKGDSINHEFVYHASLNLPYYAPAVFTVEDVTNDEDEPSAFGNKWEKIVLPNGQKDSILLYEKAEDGSIVYTQGYPCFTTGEVYVFALTGYEEYHNYDQNEVVVDKVPLSNTVVSINNALSGETVMTNSLDSLTGVVETAKATLRLDKEGQALYKFVGGLPNVISPYTLSMNITYELNGLDASWEENGKFQGILLGSIPTGTNFITEGPSETMFVLRDPPGSNSSATIAQGTTIRTETSHSWSNTHTVGSSFKVKCGIEIKSAEGIPGLYKITEFKSDNDLEIGASMEGGTLGGTRTYVSITATRDISTPADVDHVGANGDTYVGLSTNISYGTEREVGFVKNDDGEYVLGLDEIMSCSKGYNTTFIYTQYDIENKVIPKWIALRDELLLPMGTQVVDTTKTTFVSKLPKDHPHYGTSNNDSTVWGKQATGIESLDGPSYTIYPARQANFVYVDSVAWCNNQVANWKHTMANNERQKVDAIEKGDKLIKEGKGLNYSLGDASITQTVQRTAGTCTTEGETWNVPAFIKLTTGATFNGIGWSSCIGYQNNSTWEDTKDSATDSTQVTSFTLSDNNFTDMHSIDVYSVDGDPCPIFYLKAGQTSCPYEGEQLTKYYEVGKHTLSVKTQQVDKPKLMCDNPVQTQVPAGEKASFVLKLSNESESNTDMSYNLSVYASSNPHGAEVKIDGVGPSCGVYLQPGQTVLKTLTIAQGNPDVMDYENITVALTSTCQNDPGAPYGAIASTVQLSAHFVPSCSKVNLAVDNTVVNQETNGQLTLTVNGYNVNSQTLKNIQIQYKKPADLRWTTIKGYYNGAENKLFDNWEDLNGVESKQFVLKMEHAVYADGLYQFRAISECTPVNNQPVFFEGEVIEVVKDMQGPMLIAMPSPKDGVYDVGDQISVVFNEDIQSAKIQENTNITVHAMLNEYKVDHAVAFYSDGVGAAHTEALVDLSNRPFALNFWLNYSKGGVIFSHGSKDNALQLDVTDNKTYIRLANKVLAEAEALPKDAWIFVSISVAYEMDKSYLTLDYAMDAQTKQVFNRVDLGAYEGSGTLNFGGSMVGSIHEVSLWNTARTAEQAFSEKDETKAPYTQGLIGYWKMDEGVGLEAKDLARARHIILPNAHAWKLSTPNISLRLAGQEYAAFDMTACPTTDNDNYLLEFWFKADVNQQDQFPVSLLSTDNGIFALQANRGGLQIVAKGKTLPVSERHYLDNAWHHVALNVLNKTEGVSILYIDGIEMAQYAAGVIPGLQCSELRLGENMAAQFDELRYWKATMAAIFIRENMYHRETEESSLLAYYNFEKSTLDEGNQSVVVPNLEDKTGRTKVPVKIVNEEGQPEKHWDSTDTPPLKAASVMQNVPFVFTASNREITIEPTIDLAQIEGTVLHFMLKGIQDENGNYSDDIKWCATVQKNPLVWEENTILVEKYGDEEVQFTATLKNKGGAEIAWHLNGLPTWLDVDVDFGTLAPKASKTLTFTVKDIVSVGNHKANIYAEGSNVLPVSLDVTLAAYGDKPQWEVDPTEYTHSMNVIGKLIIDGKVSENANSILAAFDGDKCLGWASPTYLVRYDTYYVMMTIYGNEEHNNHALTFRAYDANTGLIHPYVTPEVPLSFQADGMQGTYNEPVRFVSSNEMEEDLNLTKGWDWVSFCVNPTNAQVESVFKPVEGNAVSIKSHDAFVSYNAANGRWMGNMDKTIRPDEMYKVYSSKNAVLPVRGANVDVDLFPIQVAPGWNWISYNASSTMTVTDAFANMSPQNGDVVKSQHLFACFVGYEWVGSLQVLQPGEGYIYYSSDSQVKSLRYPKISQRVAAASAKNITSEYPGTMNMVVQVKEGDFVVPDARVKVYAADEWRGESTAVIDDLHFVNVYGQGAGTPLRFEVEVEGRMVEVPQTVRFQEDTLLGTVNNPLVLEVPGAVDQREISFYTTDTGFVLYASATMYKVTVFDMTGRKVYSSPINGEKWAVDMRFFARGMYVVDVQMQSGHTYSFKFKW